MSLLPSPLYPAVTAAVTMADYPTPTWGLDLINGRVGSLIDGLAAVTQAIGVMLNIARYRWTIYSSNFGSELDTLPGNDRNYVMSEIQRMVPDALSIDSRITGVSNYQFSGSGDMLTVTFDVATIYGTVTQTLSVQVNS